MEEWYTLYTKANAEKKVSSLLNEQGIETYLPTVITALNFEEPFFPCYLFMKADLQKLSKSSWEWTPGLRRVICRDDQPLPVSPKIIHTIQSNLNELNENIKEKRQHQFQLGEEVRILKGPFKDMFAIFSGPTTPSTRVRILLSVLGQQKRIQMNADDLESTALCSETKKQQDGKRARRTRGRGRRIKYS